MGSKLKIQEFQSLCQDEDDEEKFEHLFHHHHGEDDILVASLSISCNPPNSLPVSVSGDT